MRADKIDLDEKFSRGMARSKWDNYIPSQYCYNMENIRINGKGMGPRLGYTTIYTWESEEKCRWLFGDPITKRLFRVMWSKWEEIDYEDWIITDRSDGETLEEVPYNFIQFGDYIVLMNGTSLPYIYDTENDTLDPATNIDSWVFSWFWEVFGNYTFLAFKNKLYFSGPIVLWEEDNAVFWTSWSSPDTQQIIYKSDIKWLVSTLNRLRIFTNDYIEYIDESTAQTVGSAANIFSVRFAEGQNLINHKSLVAVWSKLFYMTDQIKVKSVWYKEGVAELQIGNISEPDSPNEIGIDEYIRQELAPEQPDIFGIRNERDNNVEWHMRSKWSLFNDVVLIYNLESRSFMIDRGKNFQNATLIGDRMFATPKFQTDVVYEDRLWRTDKWSTIICKYKTTWLKLWLPNLQKFFRWAEFGWKINNFTKMVISSEVDGISVMKRLTIFEGARSLWEWAGIAYNPIWWQPIAGNNLDQKDEQLRPFNKVITQSQVRKKWLSNTREIETTGIWQDRYLDYMALFAYLSSKYKKYRLKDKF